MSHTDCFDEYLTDRHTQSSFQQLLCRLRSIVRMYLTTSSFTKNERTRQSGVRSQVHEPGIPPIGILHQPAVSSCCPLRGFSPGCGHLSFKYEQSVQCPLRSSLFIQPCQPATAHESMSEPNMSSCGARERLRRLCEPHRFRDHH